MLTHEFEADVPGTDSSRCFAAGAVGTAVFSATKFCAVRRWDTPALDTLVGLVPEADVILLEGFKHWPGPKIELVRRGKVRRAKLYYLRDRVGKGAKLKEKL